MIPDAIHSSTCISSALDIILICLFLISTEITGFQKSYEPKFTSDSFFPQVSKKQKLLGLCWKKNGDQYITQWTSKWSYGIYTRVLPYDLSLPSNTNKKTFKKPFKLVWASTDSITLTSRFKARYDDTAPYYF